MTTVTMQHIRMSGMCSKGARAFFERHNLDWGQFLQQGIDAKKLEATKDAMALQVAETARGQQQ